MQAAIAHDIMEHVEDYTTTRLTDEQQAIVAERMSKPRKRATAAQLRAVFRR